MEGRVRREVVDLHGEMVLLLNYSAVNYTGLSLVSNFKFKLRR